MTRLVAVFSDHANHSEHLGSAFMARLLRLVAQHWPIEDTLAQRLEIWLSDIGPKSASLPLPPCERTARASTERAISTVARRLPPQSH